MSSEPPPARPRSRPAAPSEGQTRGRAAPPQRLRDVSAYAVPQNVGTLQDVRARIIAELRPTTALGTLFAEDVAALCWEIDMYRKARAAVLRIKMVDQLLDTMGPPNDGFSMGPQMSAVDGRRRELGQFVRGQVEQREVPGLAGTEIRLTDLEADAMAATLQQLTSIDVLLAKAEQRRHAALIQFEDYEGRRATAAVQPVARRG